MQDDAAMRKHAGAETGDRGWEAQADETTLAETENVCRFNSDHADLRPSSTASPTSSLHPALNAVTKAFNRAAMRADFLRRWNSLNPEPPSDEQTSSYVSEWAANLTREGWSENQ